MSNQEEAMKRQRGLVVIAIVGAVLMGGPIAAFGHITSDICNGEGLR